MPENFAVYTASRRGARGRQEDRYHVAVDSARALLVVSDGMGGHAGGDVAAEVAVEAIAQELDGEVSSAALEDAFGWACRQVEEEVGGDGGATLLVACVQGRQALVAWVGDSPAYLVRGGVADLLTEPHLDSGRLSRWIPGCGEPDLIQLELASGDALVFCSDGVSDVLDEDDIARIIADNDPAEALVEEALEQGSSDNCTAVVWMLQ